MFSLRPVRSSARAGQGVVVHSGRSRSLWAGVVALLLALAAAGIALSPAAQAHAALRSSNPADGSVVVNLPPKVELVFNENIDRNLAAQVVLVDAAGGTTRLESTVSGPSVSAPLPRDLPAGETAVRYRVVSADSHPVAGEITFTFRPAATSPTGASDSAGSPSGASPAAPSTAATPAPAQSPTAEPARSSDGAYMMLALGGLGALIFGVIVFLLLRSDRRR